jgi:hypothetical protein
MSQTQPLKSRFVNGGCPTRCAACHEPFRMVNNHVEAWRQGAFYFCSEWCAEAFSEPTPASPGRAH